MWNRSVINDSVYHGRKNGLWWCFCWLFYSCQCCSLLAGLCFLCLPLKCWHSSVLRMNHILLHFTVSSRLTASTFGNTLLCEGDSVSISLDLASCPLGLALYLVPCEFPTDIKPSTCSKRYSQFDFLNLPFPCDYHLSRQFNHQLTHQCQAPGVILKFLLSHCPA